MLIHTTLRGPVAYNIAIDRDGREHLVMVAKQTYGLGERDGDPLQLLPAVEQLPLIEVDQFRGDPATSAPLLENDFALLKRRCDVIVHGFAHAPGGRPTRACEVGVRIGSWNKLIRVVGERVWTTTFADARLSPPAPFEVLELGYERAYGGTSEHPQRPGETRTLRENPVGVGYHPFARGPALDGLPGPNLEHIHDPISSPNAAHKPAAFGPIGRGWLPRLPLAGTYDQCWLDQDFPFLPRDFDPAFFQSAPPDQQIAHPRGDEPCSLIHLTPAGTTNFRLPNLEMPVEFVRADARLSTTNAVMDTLIIDAEAERVTLTWRASLPLARSLAEVREVVFGRLSPGWARARSTGKTYYHSLAELVDAKRDAAFGPS